MNHRSIKESIQQLRRCLSAESYAEYEDAIHQTDLLRAQRASDLIGKIDSKMLDLEKLIDDYLSGK